MKKKPELPNFDGWGEGCCKSNAESVAIFIYNAWEAYHKQEMEKINYPHIKCLKRCDDNRCDCIKDFINFLQRRNK